MKIAFFKNRSKSLIYSLISVSQGHTDIPAGNTGYSLYSSASGEVQAMACTEQGTDKFNVVPFLCNCSTQYQLLHNVYLFLPNLLASVFGHLHAACCSVAVCSLCVNVFGDSLCVNVFGDSMCVNVFGEFVCERVW